MSLLFVFWMTPTSNYLPLWTWESSQGHRRPLSSCVQARGAGELAHLRSSPQPMTNGCWRVNPSARSSLKWDNSEPCVFHYFLDFPSQYYAPVAHVDDWFTNSSFINCLPIIPGSISTSLPSLPIFPKRLFCTECFAWGQLLKRTHIRTKWVHPLDVVRKCISDSIKRGK